MNSLTKSEIKTLNLRKAIYLAELKACTTKAMRRCVLEALEGVLGVLSRGHW